MTKIHVRYCTNYNGVCLETEDANGERDWIKNGAPCETEIVDALFPQCGPDGHYGGEYDVAEETIKRIVAKHYGDVEVEVEFDHVSD